MADLVNNLYELSEDSMVRLMKDLNYMFTHLDERNVKRLYTEYCNIQSENGETEIDGPLLLMKANGSSTIRLKAGWDAASSEFVFNLYGVDGTLTVNLDSTGDAVFTGTVNTDKDVFVGEHLYVGWGNSTLRPTLTTMPRGTYFLYPGSTQYIANMYTADWDDPESTAPVLQPAFLIESSGYMYLYSRESAYFESDNNLYIRAGVAQPSTTVMVFHCGGKKIYINHNLWGSDFTTEVRGTYIGRKGYIPTYMGNQKLVDRETVSANEIEYDYVNDEVRYFNVHNSKSVCMPTTVWTVIASTSLRLTGSLAVQASTRSIAFVNLTTSAYYMEAWSTIASVDLTAFTDGTPMTTNDKLVMVIYVSSTAAINTDRKVYIHIGNSTLAYNEYNFNTINYSPGWQIAIKTFSPSATVGAPNMANVTWARLGWRTKTNSTSAYINFDHIGVHRVMGTVYSDFQRNVNSTHIDFQDASYSFAGTYNNMPVINMVDNYLLNDESITLANELYNFETEIRFITHKANYSPSLKYALYDSTDSGYMECHVSSGVLRLRGLKQLYGSTVAGTTVSDYINCLAFAQFKDCTLKLKNVDGTYTAMFYETTSPDTYREVSLSVVTPVIDDLIDTYDIRVAPQIGKLYLGNVEDSPAVVYSAKVKKSHNLITSTGLL